MRISFGQRGQLVHLRCVHLHGISLIFGVQYVNAHDGSGGDGGVKDGGGGDGSGAVGGGDRTNTTHGTHEYDNDANANRSTPSKGDNDADANRSTPS